MAPPPSLQNKLRRTEMRLVVACCRLALGRETSEGLARELKKGFSPTALFDLSEENRLLLLVYRYLVQPNRSEFSEEILRKFDAAARERTLRHVLLANWTIKTHRLFQAEKIPHVYLKGPVLNDSLFPRQVVRYSKDLDVVVPPSRVLQADELLRGMGFTADRSQAEIRRYLFWGAFGRKDIVYSKPGHRQKIELHWKLDQVNSSLNFEGGGWEKDLSYFNFQGEAIPVLADVSNCLYLCLHAALHSWWRLIWLLDFALFVNRRAIDIQSLLLTAKSVGLEAPVLEALTLRELVFSIPWPDRTDLQAGRRRDFLAGDAPDFHPGLIYRRGLLYQGAGDRITAWAVDTAVAARQLLRRHLSDNPR